ncbi:unnamed protein product [Rotaria sp. Silwood1]|nr:unnamed protein product [Rotaria sp. Silwood1]
MAYQHDQKHEKQGCIQLVRCIPPTDEELKNPQYVPQLEINSQAQQILAERFEAPISIIVYVGNMGVGKSKLATVTVAALEKETPGTDLLWFRSGAGTNGVTQGVWMWSEPLRHPDQDEKTKGSILILDCEGTDNLDENTGANLYFFCMVVSTAFAVVLRPARIDRFQCDRLYHALNRFEVMKSLHVLPNIWLLPLDLPKFLHIDRDTGDDIEISKDEWLHQIFSVDEERNNLSSGHNQRLKEQYEYITRDEGARTLADMLRVNKILTYLNIRNNCISNDGAQVIAESLIKNSTLTELDISDNNDINETGFELFATTLLGNKTLLFLTTGYRMADAVKQMLQTSRENLIVYKQ